MLKGLTVLGILEICVGAALGLSCSALAAQLLLLSLHGERTLLALVGILVCLVAVIGFLVSVLGMLKACASAAFGLSCFALAVYLLLPSLPGERGIPALFAILVSFVGVIGFLVAVAGWGLLMRRFWGRWLNIVLSLSAIAFVVFSLWPIEKGDGGDLLLVAIPVAVIVFMFLPAVRVECVRQRRVPVEAGEDFIATDSPVQ